MHLDVYPIVLYQYLSMYICQACDMFIADCHLKKEQNFKIDQVISSDWSQQHCHKLYLDAHFDNTRVVSDGGSHANAIYTPGS